MRPSRLFPIILCCVLSSAAGAEGVQATADSQPRPRFSLLNFHQELRQAGLPPAAADDRGDYLAPVNRRIFAFNTYIIRTVVDPTAATLDKWLPQSVKQAGSNVYANMIEPEFIVTNWMSGNYRDAGMSSGRFLVNSTIGVFGIWDTASELGMTREEIEFTDALCTTGMAPGPYVVLPLVGSTSFTSAAVISGFAVAQWYALSLLSPALAAADLALDAVASTASLRHARDIPDSGDLYVIQRERYRAQIAEKCQSAGPAAPLGAPPGPSPETPPAIPAAPSVYDDEETLLASLH